MQPRIRNCSQALLQEYAQDESSINMFVRAVKKTIFTLLYQQKLQNVFPPSIYSALGHVTQVPPQQTHTTWSSENSCCSGEVFELLNTDGDGEFETFPGGPVCSRRLRGDLHNIRAKMGPALQGRFSLGWRIGGIQLASGFNGHRVYFLAGNRWDESFFLRSVEHKQDVGGVFKDYNAQGQVAQGSFFKDLWGEFTTWVRSHKEQLNFHWNCVIRRGSTRVI